MDATNFQTSSAVDVFERLYLANLIHGIKNDFSWKRLKSIASILNIGELAEIEEVTYHEDDYDDCGLFYGSRTYYRWSVCERQGEEDTEEDAVEAIRLVIATELSTLVNDGDASAYGIYQALIAAAQAKSQEGR